MLTLLFTIGFIWPLKGKYIEEAENYAQQTELTKRVKEWQEKILPVLEEEVIILHYSVIPYCAIL